jgi:hypothetical protein
MPAVRRKFSACGHKAFGLECPVCKDIKKGILIEVTEGQLRKLKCQKKTDRDAAKHEVKIGGKKMDVKELEVAMTSVKRK